MKYSDLMSVPYKKNGRSMDGMDCYGFDIECFRRIGKLLTDIKATKNEKLEEVAKKINVYQIPEPKKHCGVQWGQDGRLHVGFMLDTRTVLHMTEKGVRISPIHLFRGVKYFGVINERDNIS